MKKLLIVTLLSIFVTSCSTTKNHSKLLKNVSTKEFSYKGTDIYYQGELCAQMGAIEVAYDDGKIVHEVTYVVVSERYNSVALGILKYIRERKPSWEVEVELKREINSL
jgi:hypothetical protein